MKNFLVVGGAGYIGSVVVNNLIDLGYKVIVIDNLSTGHKFLVNKKAISLLLRLLFLFLYYGYTTNLSLPFFSHSRRFFGKEILLEKTSKEIKTLWRRLCLSLTQSHI